MKWFTLGDKTFRLSAVVCVDRKITVWHASLELGSTFAVQLSTCEIISASYTGANHEQVATAVHRSLLDALEVDSGE